MLRVDWLCGCRASLKRSLQVNFGGGRKSRRKPLSWQAPFVEVLEVRQVLDGDPIPPPEPCPIDAATAASDASSARSALVSAATSFDGTVSTLEGVLNGDFATHQTSYDNAVDGALSIFDAAIDGINSSLSANLDSLGNGFDTLVDGHNATFDGDLDAAESDFNTNMSGPTATLNSTLSGIDSAFDAAIATADAQFDNAINGPGGFKDVLDGVVGPQQTTLTTNIAGHNSTFDAFVASEESNFNSAEAGFWSSYDTAVGTGSTGLETVYNNSLSTAASTRDGVLSTYSYLTYDPSVLAGTSAYDALIAGANATLDSDLADAAADYATNIAGRETTYNNAINGPGGAVETFNGLMDAADTAFDSAMDAADDAYDSTMATAQGVYDAAVDALQNTFDANVAAITATYDTAVQNAQDARDAAHTTHQATFDAAVETADQVYEDWINGTSASGPISVWTTVTTYADPDTGKTHYSVVTVYTDANGTSSTTSSDSTSNVAPAGTLVSSTSGTFTTDSGVTVPATIEVYTTTITPPATNGNVFLVAMKARSDQLDERLAALLDALNDTLDGFRTTRDAAIATANANYDAAAGGPTGFVTAYDDAVAAAYLTASNTVTNAWDPYQDALDLYYQSVNDAMMNGDPMPSNTPALVATRDYQLAAAGADVTLTSDLGSALVSYVSAERGFDTTRDTDIINAINDYLEDAINAVDEYQQDAIAEVIEAVNDLIDLEDGFSKADAGKQKDRLSVISDAGKQFALDENASDELLLTAESSAWQQCQKDVASEIQTLRNGEMGARVALMQTESGAAAQWDTDSTNAVAGWMTAAANAQNAFTILETAAEVALHSGLLGDYVAYVSAVSSAFDSWTTTVSNGVASQYASFNGGGTDVTDVANAWRDYDQDASAAWKSFVDADAAAFQSYAQNSAQAAQTAVLNMSAANVTRIANIAGEFTNFTSIVAPAVAAFEQSAWGAMIPWMTAAAGAEKQAADDYADAVNAYESSLVPELHDLADDAATAIDNFIDNVLGDWLPYVQNVITAQTNAAHDRVDQLDTLLTDVRNAGTTQAQDNRESWKTFKLGIVGAEDGLMSAYAADQTAQAVLGAVNNYNSLAATPLGDFEPQIGQSAAVGMGPGLPRPTSDDDYIAWGNDIAAAVNPPAPNPPTVDAGQLMQQIERSAKPQDSISIPLGGSGGFGARTPEDILRQTLDPEGRLLPQPQQYLEVDFSRIPFPSPNPYAPAGPQPPTLAESLVPVTGNLQSYRYNLHKGNYLEAAWNGANALGDVFLVKSVLQKAGTGIMKLGGKIFKSPPNLSGVSAGLEGAADGAGKAANALNKAGDAVQGAEAAGTAVASTAGRMQRVVSALDEAGTAGRNLQLSAEEIAQLTENARLVARKYWKLRDSGRTLESVLNQLNRPRWNYLDQAPEARRLLEEVARDVLERRPAL